MLDASKSPVRDDPEPRTFDGLPDKSLKKQELRLMLKHTRDQLDEERRRRDNLIELRLFLAQAQSQVNALLPATNPVTATAAPAEQPALTTASDGGLWRARWWPWS